MLLGIGPGVPNLKDYTSATDTNDSSNDIQITNVQGDPLDTVKFTVRDLTSSFTLCDEDDIVVLDETDTHGWPTVNLAANPSFEGTYNGSGQAPNWTSVITNETGGTLTASKSSTAKFGSASQSLAFSNLVNGASGAYYALAQTITLPVDESNHPLVDLPYTFSIWEKITAVFANANLTIGIDWHDASHAFISQNQTVWATNPGTTPAWLRAWITATPPSNAVYAAVYLLVVTTATTNSGTFLQDGAQFERCTFANTQLTAALTEPIINPNMTSTAGAGASLVDSWSQNGSSGAITTTVVNAPSYAASTAQRITATNQPNSSTVFGIGQGDGQGDLTLPFPTASYIATLVYQVTSGFSATARMRLAIDWYDGSGAYLRTDSVSSAYGLTVDQTWHALTFQINGANGTAPPVNAHYFRVYAGFLNDGTPTANASGAVVIGQLTFTPSERATDNPPYQSALTLAKYPTPYCDSAQPGCYTDALFPGIAYRQLRLFGGYIRNTIADYTKTGGDESLIEIDGVDYGVTLQEAPATLIIPQQSDKSAIAQAFVYAQNQGYLTDIDYTTFVQNIGTIAPIIISWQSTRDVLTKIANMTVAFYYVDYYKRLHYGPMLADSAAYNVSDSPDFVNTFPFAEFKYQTDSTQSLTDPIIEGSTQLSAQQTYTDTAWQRLLNTAITNGANVTSIALTTGVPASVVVGTVVQLNDGGGHTQNFVVSANTNSGATSLPVTAQHANAAYPATTTTVSTVGFQVNGGSPIATIDSITVNSAGQTVGLTNGNQYSQGYNVLYDPNTAVATWASTIAPNTTTTYPVTIIYRYHFPVLIRLKHPVLIVGTPGKPRRRISKHIKLDEVTSLQAALDRANAELRRRAQGQPAGQLVINTSAQTPSWPQGVPLLAGQAIQITFGPAKLHQALFQVQQVVTKPRGNGFIRREVNIGYYQADFMIKFATAQRDLAQQGVDPLSGQLITDALSVDDGWSVGDSAYATLQNVGQWGGSSTWGGVFVWS